MATSKAADDADTAQDVLPFYPKSLCQRYRAYERKVPDRREVLDPARIGWQPDYETYRAREAARLRVGGHSISLPVGFPRQLRGDLAWSGIHNIVEAQYVFQLQDFQVTEVEQALKYFKALNFNFDEVCTQNFPLPTLQHQLRKLRLDVHHGRGFCVIRGLSPKTYSPADNTIIFLGLSSYIAERRGRQDQNGNMIGRRSGGRIEEYANLEEVHIRDEPETQIPTRNRLSKDTNFAQPFHSDVHTDILALYKLSDSAQGGESLLASTWAVYNELVATRPDLICTLAKSDWPFDTFDRDPPFYFRPLLFYHNSKLILSFSRRNLAGSVMALRPANIPPLSTAQAEALDAIHFIALKHSISIHGSVGDIQFINNLGIVHGRESFQDDELNRRHIVRLWLRNDSLAWTLPPELQIAHERTFGTNEDAENIWLVEPPPCTSIKPLLRHQGSCE